MPSESSCSSRAGFMPSVATRSGSYPAIASTLGSNPGLGHLAAASGGSSRSVDGDHLVAGTDHEQHLGRRATARCSSTDGPVVACRRRTGGFGGGVGTGGRWRQAPPPSRRGVAAVLDIIVATCDDQ
jgi:hypothetical protein